MQAVASLPLLFEGETCNVLIHWMAWMNAASRKEAYFRNRGQHDVADRAHDLALEYKGRIERLTAELRLW